MVSRFHIPTMAVAALCHLCSRPALQSCRACGRSTCEIHLGPGLVCVGCLPGKRSVPPVAR